ncbi:MAG: family clan aspartic protease [Alphaproteobacteria bacterium]|nr:family clan aspartic protease [Alphaproteobacteria bacterium]
MNNGDQAVSFIYLLGVLVLVASALLAQRIPIAKSLRMAAAWALIFLAAFVAFTLKDDFIDLANHVVAQARGEPTAVAEGKTVRIRQSPDGHFWVSVAINGKSATFMVDSGATITSLSSETARAAGVEPSGLPTVVQTANGVIRVERGRAERLQLGTIERENLAVHIIDGLGGVNVLGMNFLSSLSGWGVEGRWLILRP